MTVPDFQTLMLPVLRSAADNETTIKGSMDRVARELKLTPDDLAEMIPSQRYSRLYSRVAWAKTYLVRAGLLDQLRRGVFRASERGLEVLRKPPGRIDMKFLERYPEFVQFRDGTTTGESLGVAVLAGTLGQSAAVAAVRTPEEQIDAAVEVVARTLRGDLIQRILDRPPEFLERVIVDLLVGMGYGGNREDAGRTLGRSGDGGIDGVIKEDALGLGVVYVQAKRYAADHPIGEEQIRGFSGSLLGRGATKGVFVTTSYFTEPARRFADGLRQQKVVLIDGKELGDLLLKHGIGVRTERTVDLKRIDLDYFEDEDAVPGSDSLSS